MVELTARYAPYGLLRPSRRVAAAAALCVAAVVGPTPTQNAVANGETRTISLFHAHTRESITITFRRSGSYDRGALEKLNWFLRDWRKDEPANMDPRLFDVVWETYNESGSGAPIRVVSAYRSPSTNAMLRRRSSAVAKHSQHMLGKAMDMHYEDVSMAKIREIGMRLQRGGVGYYPTAGTPFVHLDVGSVRSWPRMPRAQLARLFPDGRTVHLPADGTPLAGYEAALADIQTRGGSAASYSDVTGPRRSLWSVLFGGEDGEYEDSVPQRGRGATRTARGRGAGPQQVAALSSAAPSDTASVYAVSGVSAPAESARQPDITLAPRAARPARPQPLDDAPAPAIPSAVRTSPTAVAALTPPQPPAAALLDKPDGGRFTNAPMPPRRPADLKDVLLTAAVPLPPVRPAATELAGVIAAADLRPGAGEPAPRLALVPLPPHRPGGPAASVAAFAAPGTGVKPGLPAAITHGPSPAQAVAPPTTAPGKGGSDYTLKLDSAAMTALVSTVAGDKDDPRRGAKVDLPSVQQSVESGVVAGRLGAMQPVDGGRFSGGLARPLGAGFIKQGN